MNYQDLFSLEKKEEIFRLSSATNFAWVKSDMLSVKS